MILKNYWNIGQEVIIEVPDDIEREGNVSSLPFD